MNDFNVLLLFRELGAKTKMDEHISKLAASQDGHSKITCCRTDAADLFQSMFQLCKRNPADRAKVSDLKQKIDGLNERLTEAAKAAQETWSSPHPLHVSNRKRSRDDAKEVKITTGTLETDGGTYFQRCHRDYKWNDIQEAGASLLIGFAPLTTDGMFLQIWEPGQPEGKIAFIPFGTFLLLPGDALHGGGFTTSEISSNQRLHFCFHLDGITPPNVANEHKDPDTNGQTDLSDFCLDCPALDGKLKKMFWCHEC